MKLQSLHSLLFAAALGCAAAIPAYADSLDGDQAAVAVAVDASAAPASDTDLAKRVKSAISSTGTLRGLPIQVAVTAGVVSLTGSVPGGVEVDQAEFVASSVPGVREVNNKLRPKRDS